MENTTKENNSNLPDKEVKSKIKFSLGIVGGWETPTPLELSIR